MTWPTRFFSVPAPLPANAEQHRRRTQLHHHLPHAHEHPRPLPRQGQQQKEQTGRRCRRGGNVTSGDFFSTTSGIIVSQGNEKKFVIFFSQLI
jgi:hypothetical protein